MESLSPLVMTMKFILFNHFHGISSKNILNTQMTMLLLSDRLVYNENFLTCALVRKFTFYTRLSDNNITLYTLQEEHIKNVTFFVCQKKF